MLHRLLGQARRLVHALISWWVVLRSGLFDRAWYATQLEHRAPPLPVAVAHYVLRGRQAGLSPHPLFEPSWYAPRDWATRLVDPLAGFVRKGAAATAGPHPFFDPGVWTARHPQAATWPGGPLAHFVARAPGSEPMPLPPELLQPYPGSVAGPAVEPPTWAQVRGWLAAQQRRWRADEARRRAPRLRDRRDEAAEVEAVRRWSGAALPAGEPLVSVVMPVRNRRQSVGAAIQSVRDQTLRDWELLVVDDGSTDGTGAILADLAARDPRIRVLVGASGGSGVSAARNLAAAQARGRYVAWLDSDNRWTPQFLRIMVAAMAGQNWPVGYATAEVRQPSGRPRYRALDAGPDRRAVLDLLEVANHVDLNVLVVERVLLERVGGFDASLRRTVDYDLVWRLAEQAVPRHVPVVGVIYDDDREAIRISVTESATWREVVKNRRLIDWDALGSAPRTPGRWSVLVAATTGWQPAWLTATSALRSLQPGEDVEVRLVDDAGRRADTILLACLGRLDPRLHVTRTPRVSGAPLATNLAAAESTGEYLLAVQAGIELWPGWAGPLGAALADPAVVAAQPLVLAADGTLASPEALAGRPADDARRLGPVLPTAAVDDPVLAVRAADLIAHHGLDPLYAGRFAAADLALRAGRPGVVATGAVAGVADRLRPGAPLPKPGLLDPVAVRADRALFEERWPGLPEPPLPAPAVAVAEPPPRLRWAIKTAIPATPLGLRWGDRHFADALAAALGRLGQEVLVDHRPAMHRPVLVPEDVQLVIRGLEPAPLTVADPATVRLMWVISHPEQVTDEELRGRHRVFAASVAWAAKAAARSGADIVPLLQATDPAAFRPEAAEPDSGDPVLFVGNSRKVFRPVVRDLLAAGVDVAVHGGQWEPYLAPLGRAVRAQFVPNDRLAAAYRSAGVVLNDHWDDMRTEGFVSNRLFDGAAAGARMVSDHIDGIEALFGGLVRTYRTSEELVGLVRQAPEGFPAEPERSAIARRVGREHSFDARAATLLEHALKLRA